MHHKTLESLGQLTRPGQVWRVIRVELDVGAHALRNHPPLQRQRNSSIAGKYQVIPTPVTIATYIPMNSESRRAPVFTLGVTQLELRLKPGASPETLSSSVLIAIMNNSRFVRRMVLRRSVSSFELCLALTLVCGFGPVAHAQSTAVGTLTLPQGANDIVWDTTRSRFFASSGTSVVMINPETAQVEDTISVGSPADQIAVSDDGQYLYVALGTYPQSLGVVNRYQIANHSLDLQIALGMDTGGGLQRTVQAMVVLPGQPSSVLIATDDQQLMVFDNTAPRAGVAAVSVSSLYVRPSDGAIFGVGDNGQFPFADPQVYWFSVSSSGVAFTRSVPVDPNWENGTVTWNGSLITNRNPFNASVFDLNAGATIGHLPLPQTTGSSGACALATDATGSSEIVYQYAYQFQAGTASLLQYSLANLHPTASANITGLPQNYISLSSLCAPVVTWGTDGLLINEGDDNASVLIFLHASGLAPLSPAPIPTPTQDASRVIHLALPANGLAYDSVRNLLWASIPGNAGAAGNAVVSIDPGTGKVIDSIYVGSEPGALAISADGSHLFATLAGAPAIASVDLAAKQSSSFSVLDTSSSLYWLAVGGAGISGQSNSVIALRTTLGSNSSVIVYDSGIARANTFNSGQGGTLYTNWVQTIFPADVSNTFYAADTDLSYENATHAVYRLIVDSNGVELDTQLNSLLLGSGSGAYQSLDPDQPASLVYDTGRLFTSAGQLLTPDTKQLLGSVALTPAYGLPVPFSDLNGVVYVQSYSPQVFANFYDLGTLRPLKSVLLLTGPPCGCTTLGPSAVNVISAVRVGSNAVAVAANGEIVIAALNNFQPWPSSATTVQSIAPGVQKISMTANAISAVPGSSNLLLATPSTNGSYGNSIVTLNLGTSQVENSTFIGSEPSILATASDGSAAYAYLSGEYNVARFNLASNSRDLVFAADPAGGSNQYPVFDMAVDPEGGLAISYPGSFSFGGAVNAFYPGGTIAIFDNGVVRPHVDSNTQGPFAGDPATFALALNVSGSILYGFNSFLSTFELKRDAVSSQGLQWLSSTSGLIGGYGTTIRSAEGLIYTNYGIAVDPERSLIVGRFADPWLPGLDSGVAPDPADGRVYFAAPSGILVFDSNTHDLLARLPISLGSNSDEYPTNLVKIGPNALAFLTNTGEVYLVDISSIPLLTTPVPSPQVPFIAPNGIAPLDSSVPIIQPGSWISIFGLNFASSVSTWNGNFPTSLAGVSVTINGKPAYLWYISPTQINLQAPDDNATGTVSVQLTTPNGTATGSVALANVAPSLSLFANQYVAGEILTPDGSGAYGGGTYDLVGPSRFFSFSTRPVKPGETLVLYGVGFGPTEPSVPAGRAFTSTAPTTNPVTITIGGEAAKVLFSGIVATGLYQINLLVPVVPGGDQPIQASVGGTNAPLATVTVQ